MQFAAVETFLHIRDRASVFYVGNSTTGRFWAINVFTRVGNYRSDMTTDQLDSLAAVEAHIAAANSTGNRTVWVQHSYRKCNGYGSCHSNA